MGEELHVIKLSVGNAISKRANGGQRAQVDWYVFFFSDIAKFTKFMSYISIFKSYSFTGTSSQPRLRTQEYEDDSSCLVFSF